MIKDYCASNSTNVESIIYFNLDIRQEKEGAEVEKKFCLGSVSP